MSQTTNPLVVGISNDFDGVIQEIYDATNVITDNFTYAKVANTDKPKSFYVVHTVKNYSSDQSGTSYLVPPDAVSGSSDAIQASGCIRSAQGFDVTSPGLVLFEHINYKGNGSIFINSNRDISAAFSFGQTSGASSAVVTGGKWRLYINKNMQGRYIDLPQGSSLVPTFVPLGINDTVQSIEYLEGQMSHTTNPLVLGNNTDFAGLTQQIYDTTNVTTDNFTYAKVANTDKPKSFYVVYTAENYSSDQSGTSYLVPPEAVSGSSDAIQASGSIRSAQGFDVTSPGLVLFEHINYKGNGRIFINSNKDVNAAFPVGQVGGASSAVVTGGKWRLYVKKNMQGGYFDVPQASPLVSSFVQLGVNDSVQSIESLQGKISQTTNPLVLGKTSRFTVQRQIYNDTNVITGSYTYAKVSNTDKPKSFYVVYTAENFSSDQSGTSYLVPPEAVSGSSDAIQASGSIRSAQGFDVTSPGLVLFEHINYKGNGSIFINSNKDINASFPVSQTNGASSAVVTGGKWRLYLKKNMQGGYIDLPQGSPLVPSFVQLGLNDVVQSIERLKV